MKNPFQKLFSREGHTCPWWLAYSFDNPIRRLIHNPDEMLRPWVAPGQTAIDIGCGMGYFTMGLARLVGTEGLVIAVDLQEKMLQGVKRRAERAGLLSRIRLHQNQPDTLGINDSADFALAFWMVHEVKDREAFLREVRGLLKPRGLFLVAEPVIHVSAEDFQKTINLAREAGLEPYGNPGIRLSRTVLFRPV